nr:sigma-70 family RNA polymerase sigma factor [uncultured Oscillibacter sp.]
MRDTRFDTRSSEWLGDMTVWLRENAPDNAGQLERLRRNLRRAREQELTPCQRQVVDMHFDRKMSVAEIARELGVNPSSVSRALRRAKDTLRRCLQYSL